MPYSPTDGCLSANPHVQFPADAVTDGLLGPVGPDSRGGGTIVAKTGGAILAALAQATRRTLAAKASGATVTTTGAAARVTLAAKSSGATGLAVSAGTRTTATTKSAGAVILASGSANRLTIAAKASGATVTAGLLAQGQRLLASNRAGPLRPRGPVRAQRPWRSPVGRLHRCSRRPRGQRRSSSPRVRWRWAPVPVSRAARSLSRAARFSLATGWRQGQRPRRRPREPSGGRSVRRPGPQRPRRHPVAVAYLAARLPGWLAQ